MAVEAGLRFFAFPAVEISPHLLQHIRTISLNTDTVAQEANALLCARTSQWNASFESLLDGLLSEAHSVPFFYCKSESQTGKEVGALFVAADSEHTAEPLALIASADLAICRGSQQALADARTQAPECEGREDEPPQAGAGVPVCARGIAYVRALGAFLKRELCVEHGEVGNLWAPVPFIHAACRQVQLAAKSFKRATTNERSVQEVSSATERLQTAYTLDAEGPIFPGTLVSVCNLVRRGQSFSGQLQVYPPSLAFNSAICQRTEVAVGSLHSPMEQGGVVRLSCADNRASLQLIWEEWCSSLEYRKAIK